MIRRSSEEVEDFLKPRILISSRPYIILAFNKLYVNIHKLTIPRKISSNKVPISSMIVSLRGILETCRSDHAYSETRHPSEHVNISTGATC